MNINAGIVIMAIGAVTIISSIFNFHLDAFLSK